MLRDRAGWRPARVPWSFPTGRPTEAACSDRARGHMRPDVGLLLVKTVHTIVWLFFVVCIVTIPIVAVLGRHQLAAWLAVVVVVEIAVLFANHGRCPLTDVAARYTSDRRDNFDIFLPLWLARYNKHVFGTLFVVGSVVAVWAWLRSP